jgi:hypothetical protein
MSQPCLRVVGEEELRQKIALIPSLWERRLETGIPEGENVWIDALADLCEPLEGQVATET